MGTNIFISFRFKDGEVLKKEIEELFSPETEIYNRSENEDRSTMSEETIRKYLYGKLKETSVTIILLTPLAMDYRKDTLGGYDDWLYDELRYSLQDRENNRTNGVIAVYTDETENNIYLDTVHTCSNCNEEKKCRSVLSFDNLARKNILNIKDEYKSNPCSGLYDSESDSFISMVHIDKFKKDFESYITKAKDKRDRKEEFNLVKEM